MNDWTQNVRESQPNVKIVTMWFKLDWNTWIRMKKGLEVRVKDKEYIVHSWGEYDVTTGLTRVDLKEV